MSQILRNLAICKISSTVSQVTPQAKSIEMVQYFLDRKRDNWIGLEPGGHIHFLWQKVLWKVHDQIVPTHRVH